MCHLRDEEVSSRCSLLPVAEWMQQVDYQPGDTTLSSASLVLGRLP